MSTFRIDRAELERVFSPRYVRAFEQMQDAVASQGEAIEATVGDTGTLREAAFVTLSANAELPNEYVLSVGAGLGLSTVAGGVTLYSTGPRVEGGHELRFVVAGPSLVSVPVAGVLATLAGTETLSNKTLDAPSVSGMVNAANDAAAAGAGVPVGGLYHNAGVVQVRLV